MAAVDVSDEPPPPAPKERSGLLEFLMCGDEEVAVWDRIRPDAPSAASPARRIEELENTVKELSRLVKPHLRHKHSKKHPKKKEKEVEFEAVDDDEECKDSSSSYTAPHGTGGIVDKDFPGSLQGAQSPGDVYERGHGCGEEGCGERRAGCNNGGPQQQWQGCGGQGGAG